MLTGHKSLREAAKSLQGKLPITKGMDVMADVTNMDTEMAKSLNDAMGSMLAVQVLFRELQLGAAREDSVAQCRAGMNMTTPIMTPAARLQLVMNVISPQAVAGKAGTAATEDGVSTSASCNNLKAC